MLSEIRAAKGKTEPKRDETPVEMAVSNNLPIIRFTPWVESTESKRANTDSMSHILEDLISRSNRQKDFIFDHASHFVSMIVLAF